jgi:hypothetical protein
MHCKAVGVDGVELEGIVSANKIGDASTAESADGRHSMLTAPTGPKTCSDDS